MVARSARFADQARARRLLQLGIGEHVLHGYLAPALESTCRGGHHDRRHFEPLDGLEHGLQRDVLLWLYRCPRHQ